MTKHRVESHDGRWHIWHPDNGSARTPAERFGEHLDRVGVVHPVPGDEDTARGGEKVDQVIENEQGRREQLDRFERRQLTGNADQRLRNARLRCTGPGRSPVARAHALDASPRHVLRWSSTATWARGTSARHRRTDGSVRSSAVRRHRATPEVDPPSAPAAAPRLMGFDHGSVKVSGRRAAGAQQRSGVPVPNPIPSAANAAERSSWKMCTSMSERAASANAIGPYCVSLAQRSRDGGRAAPTDRPALRRMWPAHPAARWS